MNAHTHSHCHDLLGSLSDYADGTLRDTICKQIEEHIAECENCRIVVDTLRKTITIYKTIQEEPADVPAPVRERLYRTLHLEEYLHH